MKVLSNTGAPVGICLACRGAFGAEGVFMQPFLNRWDRVEFKISASTKPLAERLCLIEEVSTVPPPVSCAALPNDLPPESPAKLPLPQQRYAVVNDGRIKVERPDNEFAGRRPRSYFISGSAKSIYWRPAGART